MDKELTTSKIEDDKFYLGQTELSLIVKRILRHYRYLNKNNNPESVVIPLLTEVEGVKIEYERLAGRPRVNQPGNKLSKDDSGE